MVIRFLDKSEFHPNFESDVDIVTQEWEMGEHYKILD